MSADPTVPDARSDALLLAAFTAGEPAGREAAFAELVRRHALMVLCTCRRIVGNSADAEDAGQAVFLTLAHKARSLVHHPTIAGWLHRVARNISIRSRDARAARQRREGLQEASSMHSANDPFTATRREELREVLDAGLERLSERYRLPLVLHYLEGRPRTRSRCCSASPPGPWPRCSAAGASCCATSSAGRGWRWARSPSVRCSPPKRTPSSCPAASPPPRPRPPARSRGVAARSPPGPAPRPPRSARRASRPWPRPSSPSPPAPPPCCSPSAGPPWR